MQQQQRGMQQQHGSSNNTAEAQEIEHVHAKSPLLRDSRILARQTPDASNSESRVLQTASRTKSSIGGRVRITKEARAMALRFLLHVICCNAAISAFEKGRQAMNGKMGSAPQVLLLFGLLAVVGGCGAGLVGQLQLVYQMVHSHRQQGLDLLPATIKGDFNRWIKWCVQNLPRRRKKCLCRCGCPQTPSRLIQCPRPDPGCTSQVGPGCDRHCWDAHRSLCHMCVQEGLPEPDPEPATWRQF